MGENLLGLEDCKDVGIKVRLLRRGGNKPGVEGELGGDEGDLDVPFSIFFFFRTCFHTNLSLSFLLGGLSCVGGRVEGLLVFFFLFCKTSSKKIKKIKKYSI